MALSGHFGHITGETALSHFLVTEERLTIVHATNYLSAIPKIPSFDFKALKARQTFDCGGNK
jgi:hypothetical protein